MCPPLLLLLSSLNELEGNSEIAGKVNEQKCSPVHNAATHVTR